MLNASKENTKTYLSDSNDDSDECYQDVSTYEKKLYMVMIPHTLFWQHQASEQMAEFTFNC